MSKISNVLIVGDFADINGGQAKVSIDSARLLADHGINVTFFAACGPVSPLLRHPKIRVICLEQPDILSDKHRVRAMMRGIWNREGAIRLSDTIGQLDPAASIVHCHGYAKALSPSIGPVLARSKVPVVYTMHEYFLACPNGGFFDFQANEICTRRPLGASCLATNCDVRKRSHKMWRTIRQLATWGPGAMPRSLRHIIYISDLQKEVMQPHLSNKSELHYVPNPISAPDLPQVDFRSNDIFLFIGRLNPEKGGRHFAEAARRAKIRAVFVGDGIERQAIQAANPNAEIVGWQSPETVQGWISRARALVFPSLWYEGQPLVPLEALTRGVPVVCGTWSAARECVTDGKTGALYDDASVEALCQALVRVLDVPAFDPTPLRRDLSPEAHLNRLLGVYALMREDTIM